MRQRPEMKAIVPAHGRRALSAAFLAVGLFVGGSVLPTPVVAQTETETEAAPAIGTAYDRVVELLASSEIAPEAFSYASVDPMAPDGFVLTDLAIRSAPTDYPLTIERLEVMQIDLDAIEAGTPPQIIDVRITGMSVTAGSVPQSAAALAALDLEQIRVDLDVSYRFDPTAGTMVLAPLTLTLEGLAHLSVSVAMEGVPEDADVLGGPALAAARIRDASIAFEDRSLVQRVADIAAQDRGMATDTFMAAYAEQVAELGRVAGNSAAATQVVEAVLAFLADFPDPMPLTISMHPAAPVPIVSIMGTADLDETAAVAGLEVRYGR